jgi:hypothetical protein
VWLASQDHSRVGLQFPDVGALASRRGDRVNGTKRPAKAIGKAVLALTLILTGAAPMAIPNTAQAQAPSPMTTGVLVILTVKPGVTREQVMAVMPDEIRQTVQLYLEGKIREWYSRGDGRGVVFLLAANDVAEAQATMAALPLAKQDLMDHDYIAVGPLLPLRLLAGAR